MGAVLAALIRHGDYHQLPDTPSAWQPFPLTEKGAAQAQHCAEHLRSWCLQNGWHIDADIACSHLLRAWQTAQLIAQSLTDERHAFCVHEFTDLAERCVGHAGNLSNRQIAAVMHQDPRLSTLPEDWKADSQYCLPFVGAESLMTAGQRVAERIRKEVAALDSRDHTVKIFVGHGAAFRHAAYHLGVLELARVSELSMYHCHPIFLAVDQQCQWTHVAGEWKPRSPGIELPD